MNLQIKLDARRALANGRFCGIPSGLLSFLFFALFVVARILKNRLGTGGYTAVCVGLSLVAFASMSALKLMSQRKYILLSFGKIPKNHKKLRAVAFFRAIVLRAVVTARKTLLFVLYELLPVSLTAAALLYLREKTVNIYSAFIYFLCVVLLAVMGAVFCSVSVQRFSRAMFFLAAFENMKPSQAVSMSIEASEKRNMKLLLFKISFLPWFFLCIFIVPAFFVVPYYKQSLTVRFKRGL